MQRASVQPGVGIFGPTVRERTLLTQVLTSGRLSNGSLTCRFERGFAEFFGCYQQPARRQPAMP